MSESGLRSGEIADAAGVNVQTLRYYERRGLLHEPNRTLGGHRLYPPEAVTVLRVIKAAQRLGFTLDEVADLLKVSRLRAGRRADRIIVGGRVGMAMGVQDEEDLGAVLLRKAKQLLSCEGRIDDRSLPTFLVDDQVGVVIEGRRDDLLHDHGRVIKRVIWINLPGRAQP